MKYFTIFDRNDATIYHSQWKIANSSDMFLQYSVLCRISNFFPGFLTGKKDTINSQLDDGNFNLKNKVKIIL